MAGTAKILIIDDDEDYRTSTRALLEGEGHEVLEAPCGAKGLEAVRANMPDLIILDIMMESPVEGYTVVQALKHREEYDDVSHIPIIMVSSVTEDPTTLFPMSGDVSMIMPDAYFTKPLEIAKFLPCVLRMLGK